MHKKHYDKRRLSVATKKKNPKIFRIGFLRFFFLQVSRFLLAIFLFSTFIFADWPMQGFNSRRTGFSSRPGPLAAELKWFYDFGYWYTHSQRLQDNACPVIGPDHTIYQITENYLFAFKPDGTVKWKAAVSGRLAPALSPDGTRIYAPTSIFEGITALNAADGSTAWVYSYPGYQDASYSSLAVDGNGTIYIGTRLPATLYALHPNGNLKWAYTYPNSSLIGIEAPPAIGPDGSVYCIVNTVGLVALNSNGAFQWSNGDNSGDYGWPTPCVLSNGTIIIAGDQYSSGIIAYNPNGVKKWERLDIGGPGGFFPGVAVSEQKGIVYTARSGGKMYALDAQNGDTKWFSTVTSGENLDGSPVLASNGVIYMMGTEGHLYAIREIDGTLLWQYQLNSSGFYWGPQSPALGADGTLYAAASGTPPASGNIQARLYAFNFNVRSIEVTAPNGGENWTVGTSRNITWTSTGTIASVKIEYSLNNGSSWSNVTAATANDGSHAWGVPNAPSSQCLVRISDTANTSIKDTSNAPFSIVPVSTTLTIAAGTGGTTDPVPGIHSYPPNTIVQVTAIPDNHHEFVNWTGSLSSTQNPLTITMDGDKSIKANFRAKPKLTVQTSDWGTTTPAPGIYYYSFDSDAQVAATAATYACFTGWTGDASGTDSPLTVRMGRDKTIKANFRYIHAPVASGDKVLNRSFSQAEYIDILSWQNNADNTGLTIAAYKIYTVSGTTYTLLTEVNADQSTYSCRNAGSGANQYAIAAVTSAGREGAPALITVQ